jgi:hypothetical protein
MGGLDTPCLIHDLHFVHQRHGSVSHLNVVGQSHKTPLKKVQIGIYFNRRLKLVLK